MRRFHWSHAFKMKPDQVATCLRCAFIFCCLASWRLGTMYVSHIFHYQWHQLPFFVSPVVLFHVFSFKWNIYFIRKITRCVYSIIFQMNMFMMDNWFLESWFHLSQTVLSKSGSRQAAFCFSKMQAGVFLVGERKLLMEFRPPGKSFINRMSEIPSTELPTFIPSLGLLSTALWNAHRGLSWVTSFSFFSGRSERSG